MVALELPPLVYTFIYDIQQKPLSPDIPKKVTIFSLKYPCDHERCLLQLAHQLPAACWMKAKFLTLKALCKLVSPSSLPCTGNQPPLTPS